MKMSGQIITSNIKSEPVYEEASEDVLEEADVSHLEDQGEDEAEKADKFVEDLEKQLASHLTLTENEGNSVSSDDTVIRATSTLVASPDMGAVSCSTPPASASADVVDVFSLKEKLLQADHENESLRKSTESLQLDLATMRAQVVTAKAQLADVTAQYLAEKKMTEVIAKVQNTSSNAQLNKMQENDSLTKEVTRLQKDVKMTMQDLMALEKDLNASRESVKLLTNKLLNAETALEEVKQANEALEHQNVSVKKTCMELQQQVNMFRASEQQNLQKIRSNEENMERTSLITLELSALKSHHDAIKGKLMNAELKIKDLESQLFTHRKNDLPANLIKRKLQEAQDKQKSTDSAMTVLVHKLAALESVKEDAEIARANMKIAQSERNSASDKIKRLKRRLKRKSTDYDTLRDKCSSLITLFRNLEERSAKGDLLTRSDFDTALNFIISSDLTNLSRTEADQTQQLDFNDNSDEEEITVLSPSPTKDVMEKVVKKLKAVEITSTRCSESAKPNGVSKTLQNIIRRGTKDRFGKKKVSGSRSTHSKPVRRSIRARSRSNSYSSDRHARKRNSVSSRPSKDRDSSSCRSTSQSIQSVSRSRSVSADYEYSRYSGRSHSRSYRGTCRSRNCSADYCPSRSRQSRSTSREPPYKRRTRLRSPKNNSEKVKSSRHDRKLSEAISKETSSAKQKQSINKQTERSNEPVSTAIKLVERLHIDNQPEVTSHPPVENNKPVQVYESCLLELDIDSISGNKGKFSPDITVLGVKKHSETSENVLPLEEGELVDFLNPSKDVVNVTDEDWDALLLSPVNRVADESVPPEAIQGSQKAAGTSSSNAISSSSSTPEIKTVCVIDDGDDDVEESMPPVRSPERPFLLPTPTLNTLPLLPPPSPPPLLAVEIKSVPAIYLENYGNYKSIQMDRDSQSGRVGSYAKQIPGRQDSYNSPNREDWDAESISFNNEHNNGRPRNWTFRGSCRGNYNSSNGGRSTIPASRPYRRHYRGKNKRHFPYSRTQRCPTIPLQVNLGASSSQSVGGLDFVDEYMQLYTISIRREIPGFAGKDYVEILKEQCVTNGWDEPIFTYHAETTRSPGNNKLEYFCKVFFNGTFYQPKHGSTIKKDAQSIAALYCLQELGVLGERT